MTTAPAWLAMSRSTVPKRCAEARISKTKTLGRLHVSSLNLPTDHLFTVPEVARYLNIGKSTIYNLMDSGRLPYVKI
jgi:hypothetical protein